LLIADYARRILALNDELLARLTAGEAAAPFRFGLPESYADYVLPLLLADDRRRGVHRIYDVVCDVSPMLLKRVADGELDVVLAVTPDAPAAGAALTWSEPLCWVGRHDLVGDRGRVLPLLGLAGTCLPRVMAAALASGGRRYEVVLTAPTLSAVLALASHGVGVTVAPRRLIGGAPVLGSAHGLPGLADLVAGLYVAGGSGRPTAFTLAAAVAELLGEGE
ncbi:hypothetical protein J8J27_21145, partial [Mycobacterium tuberculosis]|nr:hypothetical protein [Mycobacterium tuberculosis]